MQRDELNSRLGLNKGDILTSVLADHADVSVNQWISDEDLQSLRQEDSVTLQSADVEVCCSIVSNQ